MVGKYLLVRMIAVSGVTRHRYVGENEIFPAAWWVGQGVETRVIAYGNPENLSGGIPARA